MGTNKKAYAMDNFPNAFVKGHMHSCVQTMQPGPKQLCQLNAPDKIAQTRIYTIIFGKSGAPTIPHPDAIPIHKSQSSIKIHFSK